MNYKTYTICEDAYRIFAIKDGMRAGYVTLIKRDEGVEIVDVYVYEPLVPFLFFFKFKKSYRNQGVGSELIKQGIKHAAGLGEGLIWGNASGDLPRLIPWYKSFGFKFNGPTLFEMKIPLRK